MLLASQSALGSYSPRLAVILSVQNWSLLISIPVSVNHVRGFRQHGTLHSDCVVPIPLSPDKQERGQLNRTRILAQALAALLRVTVADVLSLAGPISKQQFLSAGLTQSQFEHQYR